MLQKGYRVRSVKDQVFEICAKTDAGNFSIACTAHICNITEDVKRQE